MTRRSKWVEFCEEMVGFGFGLRNKTLRERVESPDYVDERK